MPAPKRRKMKPAETRVRFVEAMAAMRHMPADHRAAFLAELFRFVAAEFALLIRDGVEVLKLSREVTEARQPKPKRAARRKPKP